MVERFSVFEPRFNDDELEEEFNNFFSKNNLESLFTNDYRAGNITVTYVDARSVINTGGSYHKTLIDFADYLSLSNDNMMYEDSLFKVLYNARTFQQLMQNIRKVMKYIESIPANLLYNMWNIVFYNKDLL